MVKFIPHLSAQKINLFPHLHAQEIKEVWEWIINSCSNKCLRHTDIFSRPLKHTRSFMCQMEGSMSGPIPFFLPRSPPSPFSLFRPTHSHGSTFFTSGLIHFNLQKWKHLLWWSRIPGLYHEPISKTDCIYLSPGKRLSLFEHPPWWQALLGWGWSGPEVPWCGSSAHQPPSSDDSPK